MWDSNSRPVLDTRPSRTLRLDLELFGQHLLGRYVDQRIQNSSAYERRGVPYRTAVHDTGKSKLYNSFCSVLWLLHYRSESQFDNRGVHFRAHNDELCLYMSEIMYWSYFAAFILFIPKWIKRQTSLSVFIHRSRKFALYKFKKFSRLALSSLIGNICRRKLYIWACWC